jgi:8-oxo-dGTP pyrophosphatase MutT (NUDIX family)
VTDPMPMPPGMAERALTFEGPPAPARAAATVVLLRPQGKSFQVYVLKRANTMVFGGVYAFPGGGVDAADRPETLRDDWPARLGVAGEAAHAVVGAAARELFEEAGVLLAGPRDEADRTVSDGSLSGVVSVVGDVSAADWEDDRASVAARELAMSDLLARRGLRLRDDLLLPWARWITPEFEPKRFDTWFFVALLPEAQTARNVSGEADRAHWVDPRATADLTMLPPTRTMLDDLSAYESIADVVAAASRRDAATPVMPRVIRDENGEARLTIN